MKPKPAPRLPRWPTTSRRTAVGGDPVRCPAPRERNIVAVTTEVPGQGTPLFVLGRKLAAAAIAAPC
jgi:hypothetical protein